MKIAIAVYVISLSFAFQHESVLANKVPTPERLQINHLPPLPGRGPIRVRPVPGGRAPVKVPAAWSSHQHVFVGTLDKVVAGPVGRSFPPMFTHKLSFTVKEVIRCLLYTSPSPRDATLSRMPSSA